MAYLQHWQVQDGQVAYLQCQQDLDGQVAYLQRQQDLDGQVALQPQPSLYANNNNKTYHLFVQKFLNIIFWYIDIYKYIYKPSTSKGVAVAASSKVLVCTEEADTSLWNKKLWTLVTVHHLTHFSLKLKKHRNQKVWPYYFVRDVMVVRMLEKILENYMSFRLCKWS